MKTKFMSTTTRSSFSPRCYTCHHQSATIFIHPPSPLPPQALRIPCSTLSWFLPSMVPTYETYLDDPRWHAPSTASHQAFTNSLSKSTDKYFGVTIQIDILAPSLHFCTEVNLLVSNHKQSTGVNHAEECLPIGDIQTDLGVRTAEREPTQAI